ncbi:MAG TPA: DUF2332 domain-containing protein [Galbitalea sp.]|jgi:hypothetical protein
MDDGTLDTTAGWYRRFADIEAPGQSAIYEDWARGVAADQEILDLLLGLPLPKRQPNLLFACARLVGSPLARYDEWRDWVVAHWTQIAAEMRVRATQTNEPRRSAVLLPVLAQLEGPIALLEVGASAGLCLYPDRYSYSWDGTRLDPPTGPSSVLLECAVTGEPPLPTEMPQIVWRAGLDLNPLNVNDASDTHWLETLIWPEQAERLARIRAAIQIVRADPPRLVRGDAVDGLPALVAEAPRDATLVVVTSASIVYLAPDARARFIDLVRSLDAHWISNEGRGIVPVAAVAIGQREAPSPDEFLLALDEHPLAWTGPHGQRLDWITPAAS